MDPTASAPVAQTKEVLQQTGQKILNGERAAQKMQREQQAQAQEQGPQPEQGGNSSGLTELKMREQQMKLDFLQKKAELDLQIRAAKASQDQALADAKMASALK
jgi:hypothetical protein